MEGYDGNPERRAIKNVDNRKRVDDMEKAADSLLRYHESASAKLDEMAIKPSKKLFPDNDKKDIEHDLAYTEKRKAQMAQANLERENYGSLTAVEVKKLSEILEYQIINGINQHNWIPFCKALKTSDYDDILNGIDMVVEYSNEERFGHLGLGVDVSFSNNLSSKFQRIKDEIDAYDGEDNLLAEVKYFKSKESGITGRLDGMPRVVVALDLGVMEDLMKRGVQKGNHAARHSVILEIQHQLKTFMEYAEGINSGCVSKLKRAHAFVSVIAEKLHSEKQLENSEYSKNDKIQEAIEDGLKIFGE